MGGGREGVGSTEFYIGLSIPATTIIMTTPTAQYNADVLL